MNDYYSVEHWTVLKNIDVLKLNDFINECKSVSYSIGHDYYIKRDVKLDMDREYFHYVVLEECFSQYARTGVLKSKTVF